MIKIEMGEEVKVYAICRRQIFPNSNVNWISNMIFPTKAYYCGYTYKQEGNIVKDGYNNSLNVSARVLLIRVKFHERENEVFVELQHLKHPVKNWTASTRINKNRREIAWQ